LILLVIVFSFSTSAVCTATLNKDKFSPLETATVSISCTEQEKGYTVNWTNGTAPEQDTLEIDAGITPSNSEEVFLETFIIPSGLNGTLNSSVNGTDLSNIASDNASVSGASVASLILVDVDHEGTFLGLSSSVDVGSIQDENGKKVSGGRCTTRVIDPTIEQVLVVLNEPMTDGSADFEWVLNHDQFKEAKDYVVEIKCFCGAVGTPFHCIDEDGVDVTNSVGSVDQPFTTSSWLTFNEDPFPLTFSNASRFDNETLFVGFDTINWLRNVTNNNPLGEPLEVRTRTVFVKNDTKQLFGEINAGSETGETDGFPSGNSSSFRKHTLAKGATTGQYFIRIIYDVLFKNQFQVAQYIKQTQAFNVSGVQDTFIIEGIEFHDFFGAEVNLSEDDQELTAMPNSNNTEPFTLLTEGFKFDYCVNGTNKRDDEISVFADSLVLENDALEISIPLISELTFLGEIAAGTTKEFCKEFEMPLDLDTHSDYKIAHHLHIGTNEETFICGEPCDFEGHSDHFFVGKIEDMITIDVKFHRKPNSTDKGNPGIFVVNQKEQFLNMFDDYNYTDQGQIPWGNASSICLLGSNTSKEFLCDYAVFPTAGEKMKVCFEARNFFSQETFFEIFNLYIDNDRGDSVQQLTDVGNFIQNGIKSVTDDDLYLVNAPERAFESDGLVLDGYSTMCSTWLDLPIDIRGGNVWDIQGDARLSKALYNLKQDLEWTWESDEFPIFGAKEGDEFPDFVTIDNVTFSYDNGSEGEYVEFVVNITDNHQ